MKQTAIEWLIDKIVKDQMYESMSQNEWIDVFNESKEIEKQQKDDYAIEFAEWCDDNYFRMGNTNIWLQTIDFESPTRFTTKELIEIFKKEKGL